MKNFTKYALISVAVTVLETSLIWFGREKLLINTAIVTPVAAVLIFFIKYVLYDKSKMLNNEVRK